MKDFVSSQGDLERRIGNSYINFKKKGTAKITKGVTQIQMMNLDKLLNKYDQAHEAMSVSDDIDPKDEYIVKDKYSFVLDLYLERQGEFMEYLNLFDIPASAQRILDISPGTVGDSVFESKLPKLDLAKFSGDYTKWLSFKSLFESIISSRAKITELVKLHYLKSCLEEEAADLVKDLPVVEDSFAIAWRMLETKFDNKRRV